MQAGSVFDFDNYCQYLNSVAPTRISQRGRPPTYAQWAKRLRYRSPRGIAMVLQGKRVPSADMIQRISEHLSHTELEHRYFEKLVGLEGLRRKGRDTSAAERELRHLNPKVDTAYQLSPDQISLIGEWFFYVIKQLVDTEGFREDCHWIAKRLRGKVTPVEVRTALRVLAELGLTERDPATGRLKTRKKSLRTSDDIASQGLRKHHRQMAERAIEALQEQDVKKREFDGLTLRVSPADISRAKEAIRQFVIQFDRKFEDLSSQRIYQLNVQFFEHTQEGKRGER